MNPIGQQGLWQAEGLHVRNLGPDLPQDRTEPAKVAVKIDPEARAIRHLPRGIQIRIMTGFPTAGPPKVHQILTGNGTSGGFFETPPDLKTGQRPLGEIEIRSAVADGGGG